MLIQFLGGVFDSLVEFHSFSLVELVDSGTLRLVSPDKVYALPRGVCIPSAEVVDLPSRSHWFPRQSPFDLLPSHIFLLVSEQFISL